MRRDRGYRAEMKYMRCLDMWLCDKHVGEVAMRLTYILTPVSVVSHSQQYYDARSLETHILCSRTFIFIVSDLVARSRVLFLSFHTFSHSVLIHFTGTRALWKFFFIIGNCCGCAV